MGLVRDCSKVIMGRVQALEETAQALHVQSNNQSIMMAELLSKGEEAEDRLNKTEEELTMVKVDKAMMEASQKQMASDLEKLCKDAKECFAEKKRLQEENAPLEKALEFARSDAVAAWTETSDDSEKLRQTEEGLKTVEEGLCGAQEALVGVFLATFNSALAQIEVRNPEVEIEFGGVHPDHEVDGDRIIKKEEDGTVSVI